MGDFNFDNAVEEKNIHSDFNDLWKIGKKDDPGYTMPASKSKFQNVLITIRLFLLKRKF